MQFHILLPGGNEASEVFNLDFERALQLCLLKTVCLKACSSSAEWEKQSCHS